MPETLYLGLEHLASGRLLPIGGGLSSNVRSTTSAFQPGDVLYGKLRPYLDRAVLAEEASVCTTELLVLRAKEDVAPRFLAAVVHLPRFVEYAIAGTTGVQHPRTSWAHAREFETLKQDARRFGVPFLNPCVNLSQADRAPEADALRLGLRFIKDVGTSSARLIVAERQRGGSYVSAGDLVRRTGLKPQAVLSLVRAGAFDGLNPNRRAALREAGLAVRPAHEGQVGLALRTEEETLKGRPDDATVC